MIETTRVRRGARPGALSFCFLIFIAACGRSEPFAPRSAETNRVWEGIGIWQVPEETAVMDSIRGNPIAAPNLVHRGNGLVWTLRSVEEIDRGIARSWPGTDDRWIAVRLDLSLDTVVVGETPIAAAPRTVILRQQTVLLDRAGNRHIPIAAHDRVLPPIDRPLLVDTPGFNAVLVFALRRGEVPAAFEIHDPLGEARLTWIPEIAPTDWIPIRKELIHLDEHRRAIWEARLDRVRLANGEFRAELELRNVGAERRAAPSPAAARLHTGGGRTIMSAADAVVRELDPGRSVTLHLRFDAVPGREALELVLPAGGRLIRFTALPGFSPEEAPPLRPPIVGDGIRASLLGARRRGGLELRIGLLNLTDSPVPLAGLSVEALRAGGAEPVALIDPPPTLWPGFEERRWCAPAPPDAHALRVTIPNRGALTLPL